MIVTAILACEVLFWVLLLGGLASRYLLRARRLSTLLLLLVPVLDVALLAIIALHLRSGGHADLGHGIGVLYLGFTVAYGHSLVRWADARFAHRFAGGPPPPKAPASGPLKVRYEAVAWLRGVLAAAIGAAVLTALVWYVGDAERTGALLGFYQPLAVFTVINTVVAVWGVLEASSPSRRAKDAERVGT
ncbi:hypothetical protein [Actinorugispora endophytica]|uniref:Uncharacterized protein n=1 Tax=Actinorugispora endophytica TaxID=1605990 RepID=A0A4R6V0F9_9ACTN|nr:hypothetical protein [Actinorugispora endophytica]TDQ53390.1 hypothetical protein EV190_104180 [Actinorugispora endophytica]